MVQDFAKKAPKATEIVVAKPNGQLSWLLVGILIGAFIMFLAHIKHWLPQLPTKTATTKTANPKTPPVLDKQQPQFTFYQLLKEDKVDVQSVQAYERTLRNADEAAFYMVQAGSFRLASDAEERRVQLLLLDLKSATQPAKLNNGKVWHRVMLGPVQNGKPLQQIQQVLADNQIEYLLSKRP